MKPITFKNMNMILGDEQNEYKPLPAQQISDDVIITCWDVSFEEKIKILFTGKIWLGVMTYGKNLQPILLSTNKKTIEGY